MRFITSEEILTCADYAGLVETLIAAHRGAPPDVERLLMQQGQGPADNSVLLWPAWARDRAFGIKIATVFPGNTASPGGPPAVQALYPLFDGRTGTPLCILDGTALTYIKTAADSAAGAHFLARADASHLLMVGAGALAPHLVRAHLAIRPSITRVSLWNRTAARARQVADDLTDAGVDIAVAESLEQTARMADVISCATASTDPLIEGAWLKPGAHVDLVGGYTPAMREADDEAARRASLFVDARQFTIGHAGDLTQPIEAGIISESDIRADLFDLAAGRHAGRQNSEEITLYKNAGGAHLDLFVALGVCSRLGLSPGGNDETSP